MVEWHRVAKTKYLTWSRMLAVEVIDLTDARWPSPPVGRAFGRLRELLIQTSDQGDRVANNGLGSWPARRARMTPERTAIVHDGVGTTYAGLEQRVNRLAHGLRGLGVAAGDRVAYLGPNHPTFLETLFATALLGAIFVPLNTRLAPAELAYILDDSGASVLVWSQEFGATIAAIGNSSVQLLALGSPVNGSVAYDDVVANESTKRLADVVVGLDDVCMIMYTSGTTGSPKGAMLTHGNLTWNCYNLLIDLDLRNDEVALISAPLFHTAALNHTALPVFLKGGTNVLVPKFDPEYSFDLIAEHRITLMFGVPAMFRQIAASARWATADLSSLRILHCGGSPVPEGLIRTYQQRGLVFVQGYGMTEAAPGALMLRPADSVRKLGSAGTPHFFTEARVVRPDLSDTATGESGEIVIRGPNVMKGYWNRPDETAGTLAQGWLHSGDVATRDAEGFVFIVDRIKDMIISGGENIYPAEVEKVLHEHPAVVECAVVGVPDERWGEVGRAVVVLRPGASAEPAEILDFLAGRLAKYKIPKSVVTVEALAHNASGKLQRNVVKSTYGAP
jgi:fatty-acyl-CoA synthase